MERTPNRFFSLMIAAIATVAMPACGILIVNTLGGNAAQIQVQGLENISTAACNPLEVSLLDVRSVDATISSPISLTISATGRGTLHSDDDCNEPLSPIEFSADSGNRLHFYYRNYGLEPVQLSIRTSNPTLPAESYTLKMKPGVTSLPVGSASNTTFLVANGALYGFGRNANYNLNDGTTTNRPFPKLVPGIGGSVKQVASSGGFYSGLLSHVCVLLDTGAIKCWGRNNFGQLGVGTNVNLNGPSSTPIDLGGNALMVDTGKLHTCALLEGGSVKCWGFNYNGQLGDGPSEIRAPLSTPVNLGGEAIKIETGDEHTCALMRSGGVKCWGRNNQGQIGTGLDPYDDMTGCEGVDDCYGTPINYAFPYPTSVINLGENAVDLSVGSDFSCVALQSGAVKCWGVNTYKTLGNGQTTMRSAPVAVQGLSQRAVAVYAGSFRACALLEDHSVQCWGSNHSGQIIPGVAGDNEPPRTIPLPGPAMGVYLGDSHTCALLQDQRTFCWGQNTYGQLGNGTTTSPPNVGEVILPFVRVTLSLVTPSNSIPFVCTPLNLALKQDSADYPAPHNLSLSLVDEEALGDFYADAGCTRKITTVGVTEGLSTAAAYYRTKIAATVPVPLHLRANLISGYPANGGAIATIVAGAVVRPKLILSNLLDLTTCVQATASIADASDNLSVYPTALTISLGGGGYGSFHSAAGCSSPTSSVTVPAGSTSATFYYLTGSYDEDASIDLTIGGIGSPRNYGLIIGCGTAGCGG